MIPWSSVRVRAGPPHTHPPSSKLPASPRKCWFFRHKELARRLGVSQPYLSKVEAAEKVSPELLALVEAALRTGAP
ncbi:MAG: helix-turn-helix domain-containing protein [Pseudomonadota bacterium]|uniref:helix-turn-helix domain-containing protein n=1 Tax=Thermithiobacillus tepidarius TaxID=929 RepID=UPI0009DC4467